MQAVNNILHLLVGKKVARTVGIAGTVVEPSALQAGEIVVTDVDGTVLDSTTVLTRDRVVLHQGQGTSLPLISSPVIYKSGVTSFKGSAYSEAVEQVDYIGYNTATSTGEFDVINSNVYELRIARTSITRQFADKQMELFASYKSDSSATQEEIAQGLAKNLIYNTEKLASVPFKVERVSNGTASASGQTATVVKGSKTVTYGANVTIAAGSIVYLAGTSYLVAVGVSAGTTITLDIPFQGDSATIASGTTYATQNGTLASVTKWGIKLTGKPRDFVVNQKNYEKNRWNTTILYAGTTPVVKQVAALEGVGTYEQVAELEFFTQGFEGFLERIAIPPVTARASAEATGTYSFITIEHKDNRGTNIVSNSPSFKQTIIAANKLGGHGTSITGVVTSVATVLDAWLGIPTGPTSTINSL